MQNNCYIDIKFAMPIYRNHDKPNEDIPVPSTA